MVRLTINLDHHQLAYLSAGRTSSLPLIMVHDLMSHRGVWRETMDVLKLSHNCVALDLLGFADSPKPMGEDYSIEAQANRILKLADAIGFERFDLMGHSMGAQIGLYIAASLAPERVNRLVSVAGTAAGRVTPKSKRTINTLVNLGAQMPFLYDWTRRLTRGPFFANLMFRSWFYKISEVPFDLWDIDRQMACQRTINYAAQQAWSSIQSTDLTPELGKITASTLILMGAQDVIVPISEGQSLDIEIPDSQLVTIDQCGHYPMYEKRDQYLDALLAFLR